MKIFIYGSLEGSSTLSVANAKELFNARTTIKYKSGTTMFYPYLLEEEDTSEKAVYREGIVYEIPEDSIHIIDKYESAPEFFYREGIYVQDREGNNHLVYCYFMNKKEL